jgi:hypothetical protein
MRDLDDRNARPTYWDRITEPSEVPEGSHLSRRPASADDVEIAPPLSGDEATQFRTQWEEIQTAFVDDPRGSVQRADKLVDAVTSRLTEVFSDTRGNLEEQWTRGDDVSTEDLRVAFRRYRSFFDRLLSV